MSERNATASSPYGERKSPMDAGFSGPVNQPIKVPENAPSYIQRAWRNRQEVLTLLHKSIDAIKFIEAHVHNNEQPVSGAYEDLLNLLRDASEKAKGEFV